eukprot:TRINITY_DN58340_c0_g1_i1.p1 TRINITY_DN58340_c0_g1~~TRINITY_DN58340_c0_g1_i1.p1  ORF type:complete len:126 (-),score=0.90 TRINITY_DN58340_c0_g1_i1:200-577(-)
MGCNTSSAKQKKPQSQITNLQSNPSNLHSQVDKNEAKYRNFQQNLNLMNCLNDDSKQQLQPKISKKYIIDPSPDYSKRGKSIASSIKRTFKMNGTSEKSEVDTFYKQNAAFNKLNIIKPKMFKMI